MRAVGLFLSAHDEHGLTGPDTLCFALLQLVWCHSYNLSNSAIAIGSGEAGCNSRTAANDVIVAIDLVPRLQFIRVQL